ncbi:helix-turn-helix transcriptional regulator, partial [Micromonospora taraxaci]|uniref:helix-turn-helix domain-containing protein n=1 Tax=Micromonospora taraxaci TaxID=1316803 RepID=UPI0033EC6BEB
VMRANMRLVKASQRLTSWHLASMIALMTKVAPTISEVIASRVRKYRQLRGWSVRELAERCVKAGANTLTQASLTNIERGLSASAGRGSRAVTVPELLSLACVLEVPPVMLLLPLGDHIAFEVSPGVTLEPLVALRWMVGGDAGRTAIGIRNYEGFPPNYDQASNELAVYASAEEAREGAEYRLQLMDEKTDSLIESRRFIEDQWNAYPARRPYIEDLARRNHRPRPGQDISDEEWVAQWRELMPAGYKLALREYVDAIWQVVNAGFDVPPPIPRRLYVDIMSSFPKAGGLPIDGGEAGDLDLLTGELRERPAPRRPVLPPNIQIIGEGDDGGR